MSINRLKGENFVSLTTFRKNGKAIPTTVSNLAIHKGKLYIVTGANTGKMKRLKHTNQVELAPCTGNGKITGASFTAGVRILSDTEAKSLMDKGIIRLNLIMHFFNFMREKRAGGNVYLEISA